MKNINHNIEVYINDIMINSMSKFIYLDELCAFFELMRMHDLKMTFKMYL